MPRPPAKSLSAIKLSDDAFKADFEIADKYQAFSSELVRLSLLGIAGYGFIFSTLPPKGVSAASTFSTHLRSDLG